MKIRCARPNCRKKVKYNSPAWLCSKHWKMWWDYGMRGKDNWWLRAINEAIESKTLLEWIAKAKQP